MMMRPLPTAALMFTEGIPIHECFWRGLVKPREMPSDFFLKLPVMKVCFNLLRDVGVHFGSPEARGALGPDLGGGQALLRVVL